ncbi:MAG TPA: type VI secretion system protein TssA [Gemmatimonadaceae bacterium]|jgi:type VI secretion system protein ImpA|nr:type VI secretion system protein TssA [Gemmatimonadaceae bacterium]
MSLRDDLLNPIPGENPGGVDLRYDPIYDKIKEARREDEDVPQGEWTTALKVADWPTVIALATDALSTKTKDLQIGAWLTEALVRREGFPGLRAGLDVLAGLVEKFWDTLYPEIDDGDLEMRAGPLDWVGLKLNIAVLRVPLDRGGNDSFQLKESRTIPTEEDAGFDADKGKARQAAIAAGKPTPEVVEAAFTSTPKAWYKTLVADVNACIASLKALEAASDEKFGNDAPGYGGLRETLTGVQHTVTQALKRKLELDPDPIEETAAAESGDAGAGEGGEAAGAAAGSVLTAEPRSRDDAANRIVSAAKYIRQSDPFNPASYLLLRGFRWGELRVGGAGIDPKLLEAPPTNVRTNLKGLLLDAKWPQLIEAAEGVMGSPQGRGWLDLQRYALTACEGMGGEYDIVSTAIRGALSALLADLPQLVDMTMMDDTPTANAETRTWLRNTVQVPPKPAPRLSGAIAAAEIEIPNSRDPFTVAMAEVKAGRSDRGISLLMREVSRQKTSRARFLTQVQLAHVMIDAGHDAVAMPVLEQLLADIDSHKLEEWEAGDVVAAPLALMFRALLRTEGDESTRQALYLRICRLDPLQAISFTQQQ